MNSLQWLALICGLLAIGWMIEALRLRWVARNLANECDRLQRAADVECDVRGDLLDKLDVALGHSETLDSDNARLDRLCEQLMVEGLAVRSQLLLMRAQAEAGRQALLERSIEVHLRSEAEAQAYGRLVLGYPRTAMSLGGLDDRPMWMRVVEGWDLKPTTNDPATWPYDPCAAETSPPSPLSSGAREGEPEPRR